MSTIMKRSAAEFWWGKENVDPNVAYYYHDGGYEWGGKIVWKKVTYAELRKKKFEKQKLQLEYKQRQTKVVPGYVWVFYNYHDFPFGGWWMYIKTHKQDFDLMHRTTNKTLIEKIMAMFPLTLFPEYKQFDLWAEKFAKQFAHKGFKRNRGQGLALCWCIINENGQLVDIYLKTKTRHNDKISIYHEQH